jgi:hypothetical protein
MDEERVATVRERLAGWLSPQRIEAHRKAGRLRLDGQPVTDLDTPYPETSRVTFGPT